MSDLIKQSADVSDDLVRSHTYLTTAISCTKQLGGDNHCSEAKGDKVVNDDPLAGSINQTIMAPMVHYFQSYKLKNNVNKWTLS